MNHDASEPSSDEERPADTDIEALFQAHRESLRVPSELDAIILAAAAQKAASDSGTPASIRSLPTTDQTLKSGRRWPKFAAPRWLAAAAVLMLAFALFPLVRQAPESRQEYALSSERERLFGQTNGAAAVLEATSKSNATPGATPTAMREAISDDMTDADGALDLSADAAFTEATPSQETRPMFGTDQVAPRKAPGRDEMARLSRRNVLPAPLPGAPSRTLAAESSVSGIQSLDDSGNKDVFVSARKAPSTWLSTLKAQLREHGYTNELMTEYQRFRRAHPDVEPDFDPVLEASRGADSRRDRDTKP